MAAREETEATAAALMEAAAREREVASAAEAVAMGEEEAVTAEETAVGTEEPRAAAVRAVEAEEAEEAEEAAAGLVVAVRAEMEREHRRPYPLPCHPEAPERRQRAVETEMAEARPPTALETAASWPTARARASWPQGRRGGREG